MLWGSIKRYKFLGTLWRHKRQHIKTVAEICAALVCRQSNLLNNIIKKKLLERANLGHGSLQSGGCIEKQIRC